MTQARVIGLLIIAVSAVTLAIAVAVLCQSVGLVPRPSTRTATTVCITDVHGETRCTSSVVKSRPR